MRRRIAEFDAATSRRPIAGLGIAQVGRYDHPHTRRRLRGGEPMAMTAPLPKLMGQPVKRREDPRLITGTSQYVDDINLAGMLHLTFVRSPYGHAKVNGIDASEALKVPGVVAVVTARDLEGVVTGPM